MADYKIYQVFSSTENLITNEIQRLTYPVGLMASGVALLASAFLLMWFTYRAYQIMTGVIADSFNHFIKDFAIKACILGLASSLGLLYSMFLYPLMDTQKAMVEELSANGNTSIFSDIENSMSDIGILLEAIVDPKDSTSESNVDRVTRENGGEAVGFFHWMWERMKDAKDAVAEKVDDLGSIWKLFMNFLKLVIVLVGLVIMGFAAFLPIIMNKALFYLSVGFAPLFIMFLAFESTRGWFTSWLSSTIGYCFSYPVAVVLVTVVLSIYKQAYSQEKLSFIGAIGCFALSLIFSALISRAGDVASAWFASTNIAGGTAAAVSSLAGGTTTAARLGGRALGKTASSTGHVVRDVGKGVGGTARAGYKLVNGFRVPTKITKE